MITLKVKEGTVNVYRQTINGFKRIKQTEEVYSGYFDYFNRLLLSMSEYPNAKFVLEVTTENVLMKLYLNRQDGKKAEMIKEKILKDFPDEIEQVGIVETNYGVVLNILDFFYELV